LYQNKKKKHSQADKNKFPIDFPLKDYKDRKETHAHTYTNYSIERFWVGELYICKFPWGLCVDREPKNEGDTTC